MLRYASTIFLSAFLLFQVQPLAGRFILPWFGGGPSIWTTCMLFFQLLLLGGYVYSHVISVRLSLRTQAILHTTLLVASLAMLPIQPSDSWKPDADDVPSVHILLLLLATVGGPYFMLATTGPLMQRWFSHTLPSRSPYRLYALSNFGSLLALLSYPFVFEPYLLLRQQTQAWSIAYVLYAAMAVLCAQRLWRFNPSEVSGQMQEFTSANACAEAAEDAVAAEANDRPPGWGRLLLWLGLAAGGSVMLLATTNQMCIDVATVPFLWVLPLSIYLLTFIICFDNPAWYDRRVFGLFLLIAAPLACWILAKDVDAAISDQIAVYSGVLFGCCMVCHGELVQSRPSSRYLTLFYVLISAGGAVGGLLVAIAAPRFFHGYWEYHVGLAGVCLLAVAAWSADRIWLQRPGVPFWIAAVVSAVQLLSLDQFVYWPIGDYLDAVDHTIYFGVWLTIQFFGLSLTAVSRRGFRGLCVLWLLLSVVEAGWLTGYGFQRFPDYFTPLRYAQAALGAVLPAIAGCLLLIPIHRAGEELSGKLFRSVLMTVIAGLLATLWYRGDLAAWQLTAIAGTSTVAVLLERFCVRFIGPRAVNWGLTFRLPLWALIVLLCVRLTEIVREGDANVVHTSRNFYGVLRVRHTEADVFDESEPSGRYSLTHGQIQHGFQFEDPWWSRQPTTYYGGESGLGMAIRFSRDPADEGRDQPIRVGVVGLGTGTIAAYGRAGDYFRFYEINSDVRDLSDTYFTYLHDSAAETEVVIGDARIVMERELAAGNSQQFDVLAIDAFSSDAIPVHLLTTQCADIYRRHLKPDGILAIHISNRYLDLNPVVRGLQQHLSWRACLIENDDDDTMGVFSSSWVLLTSGDWLSEIPEVRDAEIPADADAPVIFWTDDYSGLWRVLNL